MLERHMKENIDSFGLSHVKLFITELIGRESIPTKEEDAVLHQTLTELKRLFPWTIRETILPKLQEHYRAMRLKLRKEVQKEREEKAKEKKSSLVKVYEKEKTVKSDDEFMSDPVLLLHILTYLTLDDLLMVRQSGRYFKQFIHEHYNTFLSNFLLRFQCGVLTSKVDLNTMFFHFSTAAEVQYLKLCMLSEEELLLDFVAAKSSGIGVTTVKARFRELVQHSYKKFMRYSWIISCHEEPFYRPTVLRTEHFDAKFVFDFDYYGTKRLPTLPHARKVVVFPTFRSLPFDSIENKLRCLSELQCDTRVPIEVYFVQESNDVLNYNTKFLLDERLILYVFNLTETWVLRKDKIEAVLKRKEEAHLCFSSAYSNYASFVGRKESLDLGRIYSEENSKIFLLKLFQKETYNMVENDEHLQQHYSKLLFETSQLFL